MDSETILLKSPRGREEIRSRAHDLPPLARRLLIMADGQHTIADLAAQLERGVHDDELRQALQLLVDGRYLHVRDEHDDRTVRPPGSARPAPPRKTRRVTYRIP